MHFGLEVGRMWISLSLAVSQDFPVCILDPPVFKNWLLALMLMFSLRLMLMFLILHKTRLRLIDYVFFIFVADEYFNKSNLYSTSYSINSMT